MKETVATEESYRLCSILLMLNKTWLTGLMKKSTKQYEFHNYDSLEVVKQFSNQIKEETAAFLHSKLSKHEHTVLTTKNKQGKVVSHLYVEIILHVVVHEVHLMGQLSVWAREIGKKPVAANLIGIGLFNRNAP
jgi:uncharacterized damage-inducible protein DinB